MAIHYHFDRQWNILYAKGIDIVSLDDLLAYGRQVLEMPDDLTGAVEYIDLSAATDIAVTYQSAQQMIEVYKGWMARGIVASVIYAPCDLCYGLARMISAVISSVSGMGEGGPLVTRTPLPAESLRAWVAERGAEVNERTC